MQEPLIFACLPAGEMAEVDLEVEGEPLTPRDVLVAGEDFLDLHAPLLVLPLGSDASGLPVSVQALAVGEVANKLLVGFPGLAWNRQVAKRTVPKGFMTKVFAAEVAACSMENRSHPLEGQVIKVWLGTVESSGEEQLEVTDEPPTVSFGSLSSGELLVPFGEALAAIWAAQRGAATPLSKGMALLKGLLASNGPCKSWLLPCLLAPLSPLPLHSPLQLPLAAKLAPKPRARQMPHPATDFPGLDPGLVQAAVTAGVQSQALERMQQLLQAGSLTRMRAEPRIQNASTAAGLLDETEAEEDEDLVGSRLQAHLGSRTSSFWGNRDRGSRCRNAEVCRWVQVGAFEQGFQPEKSSRWGRRFWISRIHFHWSPRQQS